MKQDIGDLVLKIQRSDERRQTLRTALLKDPDSGATHDRELAGISREIEQCAKQINKALATYAQTGTSPGDFQLGDVLDPELKAYLAQVKEMCGELGAASGAPAVGGSPDGERIKRQIAQRKRECDEEVKKTEKAREDLKRERKKLLDEQKKIERQRDKLREQQKKAENEKGQVTRNMSQCRARRETLQREKETTLARLESARGSARTSLEQRVQQINQQLKDTEHKQGVCDHNLERFNKLLEAMREEIEQLEEAIKEIEKDQLKLMDKEDERLEQHSKQVKKARDGEDQRLRKVEQAEAELRKARA